MALGEVIKPPPNNPVALARPQRRQRPRMAEMEALAQVENLDAAMVAVAVLEIILMVPMAVPEECLEAEVEVLEAAMVETIL